METDAKSAEQLPPPARDAAGGESDFLDVLVLLASRKRMIAYITGAATFLAIVISLLLPKTYTATTRLLPPQKPQSAAAALLAQLNPLAAGLGTDLKIQNPASLYVGLLRSRFVADDLIQRFDLRKVYGTKTFVDTREELANRSSFSITREGVIEVAVEDRDPKRAADMTNAYVEALQKCLQGLAVTEASQRRLFYERELLSAKENLSDAEVALMLPHKMPTYTSGLEYMRRLRNVKYSETIFELLTKQFEAAKLDEANDSGIIQVIDKAVAPEKKSAPKRTQIVLVTAFLSFAFSVFLVVGQDYYEQQRKDPENAERLRLVRTYLLGEEKGQT